MLFVALVAIATIWVGFNAISSDIKKIAAQVETIAAAQRAEEIGRRFVFNKEWYAAERRFCPDNQGRVCNLVKLTSYDNLGTHPPLWVFLDALVQVGHADMSRDLRAEYNRVLGDLSGATNRFGVLEYVNSTSSEWTDSSRLYVAILAGAAACSDLASQIDCKRRLPSAIGLALTRAMTFIQENGAALAPYEMSFRAPAIRAVGDGF